MGEISIGSKIIPKRNPITKLIRCCSCHKDYDFKGNIFEHKKDNILVCPHCGFKHKIDFKPFDNRIDNLKKVSRLDLAYSTIDIGSSAIDRDLYWDSAHSTRVVKGNPANASGKITSVEIYTHSAVDAVEFATFYVVSGNNLSTRDNDTIGNIGSGYSQHAVSLNVQAGDYLGIHYTSGELELTGTGQGEVGVWRLDDVDAIPCTNTTFTFVDDSTFSLYGTGETVPDQVTNVDATDGDHTDKVVITWDAASGADKYYVWTGAEWVDVGDVQTYDYTGASAPTITAGTASASDETSSAHVTLSIAGESANNGSSIDYKVKAWNTAGDGVESATDSGYRGVGALTYQWQRSAADSDANYSNIDGATTDPYYDTEAPDDGSGRYYKCVENATGASQQTTNSDRGYRIVSNSNSGWLSGWDKRIELKIEDYAGDIGASVIWFPVTIFLTATQGQEVFVELTTDAEYLKVAFTKADGTTELYGEKELFDVSEKLGIYHVSRDGWVINANTSIYLYYDKDHADNTTYIGAIDTAAGTSAWDSNFIAVWHMKDATTSTIKDSTSNNRDITKDAANQPTEVDGKNGKAQNFDGTEKLSTGWVPDINFDSLTIESISRISDNTKNNCIVAQGKGRDGASYPGFCIYWRPDANTNEFNIGDGDGGVSYFRAIDGVPSEGVWYYSAQVREDLGSSEAQGFHYIDGDLKNTSDVKTTHNDATSARDVTIGADYTFEHNDFMYGDIDEVRLSLAKRSTPWIKATYNTLWDTLLTYGSEEVQINALFFGANF